jgi:multiple sugar transport system ATP-binding protein
MLVVQADGEIPTRVHERIAVHANAANCHLFDQSGATVPRLQRHPLADMKRPTAKAS